MFGKKAKKENIEYTEQASVSNANQEDTLDVASQESNKTSNIENKALYMLVDKKIPGMMRFFRESRLRVARIFTSIDDLRGALLMEDRKVRIAVIDTGSGKFTSMASRKELVDTIGVGDEDSSFTVFYTDNSLKADVEEILGSAKKSIDWVKFTGTLVVTAVLLSYKENYILSNSEIEYNDRLESEDDILEYVGDDPGVELSKPMFINGFSSEQIREHLFDESAEQIVGYAPHI